MGLSSGLFVTLTVLATASASEETSEKSGGNGTQGRQSGTGFIQLNKQCEYEDAWTRFSLEEMYNNRAKHCDPTKLLVCVKDNNGVKRCECGLVNSKYDANKARCLALAGAPCGDTLFDTPIKDLTMKDINCQLDSGTSCIAKKHTLEPGDKETIHTYGICSCDRDEGVDEDGKCTGWSTAFKLSHNSVAVLISFNLFVLKFYD